MKARIFQSWSVISFFHIWFLVIGAITSGDKSQENWFVYPLPTVSMEATEFVYLVLHQSHWPCWLAIRILLLCGLTVVKVMIFSELFFLNPKYLWTRDIYCKDESRWPASLLKMPLVHRNSLHILLCKIKLPGFSLSGRLAWNELILDDLIQDQRWK